MHLLQITLFAEGCLQLSLQKCTPITALFMQISTGHTAAPFITPISSLYLYHRVHEREKLHLEHTHTHMP